MEKNTYSDEQMINTDSVQAEETKAAADLFGADLLARAEKGELSVEEAFDALDRIVAKMEEESISLEDSFNCYETGIRLVRYCSERIDRVEKKVRMLRGDEPMPEEKYEKRWRKTAVKQNDMNSEIMNKLVKDCEDVLDRCLPDPDHMPEGEQPTATIASAMRYNVLAGGKRLRPLLIARISDIYGGRRELAEPFMAALEMIHTYSLVHDDLPAMDNDDYRRGRKTTHIVYGEGMAVLTGDSLLNFAYETAAAAFDAAKTPQETAAVVRAFKILSKNAGIFGMVGGQCADLEAENREVPITDGQLEYIHSHKTACMIDSGFTIGAVLAGAPEEDIQRLHKIAYNIGVAFQIQDDILDVIGDSKELGKQVGSDEKDGKTTYVTLHGLEQASKDVRRLTDSALVEFDALSVQDDFLRSLIVQLVSRRK